MADDIKKIIDEFVEIAARLHLRDGEVAAASGLSAPTVRIIRATRQAPRHDRLIVLIRRFVERNREVMDRGEVRLAS